VEVTPSSIMLGTELIAVRTGEQEEHITADVAWAADRYAAWTGDRALLAGPARPLILESARYWASRVQLDAQGRGHIDRVIGPDEYHEEVDDDVFTNVMARWNLLRAADLVEPGAVPDDEVRRWRELAAALVDGYDPDLRRHEQFTGYLALESMIATDVARLPFAADLVLGQQRVQGSQLIKQPDVLMAHFLVPEMMPADSLPADLDLYVPRTSHGSSLSPAITAGVLARAGRPDEALEMYRMALRLDLDDITGSGSKGLHLATLGGVWQALVVGFLGLRVLDGVLHVAPSLPTAWPTLRARLHVLGARVSITADAATVRVGTDRPLRVAARGHRPIEITGEAAFDRELPRDHAEVT
jgi:trehalose/maltose hydrolase-like predicted phosphorylase